MINIFWVLQSPYQKITPEDILYLKDFWAFAIIFGILIIIYVIVKVYGKIKEKELSNVQVSNDTTIVIKDAILEVKQMMNDIKSSNASIHEAVAVLQKTVEVLQNAVDNIPKTGKSKK